MAYFFNNGAGGTHGAAVTAANSGGASGTPFASVASPDPNTVTYDTTDTSVGLRFQGETAASNNFVIWDIPDAGRYCVVSNYYIFDNETPAAMQLFTFNDAANVVVCQIRRNPDGTLSALGSGGSAVSSATHTTPVPLDTLVRIDAIVDRGTTANTGTLTLALYSGHSETPLETKSATGANFAADIARLRMGKGTSGATTYRATLQAESTRTTALPPLGDSTPLATPVLTLVDVTATASNTGTMTVSWDAISGADYYVPSIAPGEDATTGFVDGDSITMTSHTFTGLTAGYWTAGVTAHPPA